MTSIELKLLNKKKTNGMMEYVTWGKLYMVEFKSNICNQINVS